MLGSSHGDAEDLELPELTAFAAVDGARRWTRELPEALRGGVHSLGAADDRVFVQVDDALLFLDATQGELTSTVGGGH